jgi:hypothetical protein
MAEPWVLPLDKQRTVHVAFKGSAVREPPTDIRWTSSDETVLAVSVAQDGYSATLRGARPGRAQVTVRGKASDGEDVFVTGDFDVVDPARRSGELQLEAEDGEDTGPTLQLGRAEDRGREHPEASKTVPNGGPTDTTGGEEGGAIPPRAHVRSADQPQASDERAEDEHRGSRRSRKNAARRS